MLDPPMITSDYYKTSGIYIYIYGYILILNFFSTVFKFIHFRKQIQNLSKTKR